MDTNTKIEIVFSTINSNNKILATTILDGNVNVNDIELQFGGKLNYLIENIVHDYGHLSDWKLKKTLSTYKAPSTTQYKNQIKTKAYSATEVNKIKKELVEAKSLIETQIKLIAVLNDTIQLMEGTVKSAKTANYEKGRTDVLKANLEIAKKDNIRLLENEWKLTHKEAVWANKNWEKLMKGAEIFRLTPQSIKAKYAKEHNVTPTVVPAAFDEIKEVKDVGEYISVGENKVPIQMFKDYISLIRTRSVKSWQMDEYETKRAKLHERIFKACKANRIAKSDTEQYDEAIRSEIDKIIWRVEKCTCGGNFNSYKRCTVCDKQVGIKDFLYNLNKIKSK